MAAEIGSMRVYQEIDALRTMNISPVNYLVTGSWVPGKSVRKVGPRLDLDSTFFADLTRA